MTRRVREINRRRQQARDELIAALKPLGDGLLSTWQAVLRLERIAIQCGVERVKARTPATPRTRR